MKIFHCRVSSTKSVTRATFALNYTNLIPYISMYCVYSTCMYSMVYVLYAYISVQCILCKILHLYCNSVYVLCKLSTKYCNVNLLYTVCMVHTGQYVQYVADSEFNVMHTSVYTYTTHYTCKVCTCTHWTTDMSDITLQ